MNDRPIPYAVAQRLRLIDVMLAHFGQVKRGTGTGWPEVLQIFRRVCDPAAEFHGCEHE